MNESSSQISLSDLKFSRNILPNIALIWLAQDSLERAETITGNYQRYLCVASITFASLAVEAFLNVIGSSLIKRWEDLEGNSSPLGKLAVIENSLGFNIDRSRAPFSAFSDLFKFRNLIVHAKPESLPIVFTEEESHPIPMARAKTPLSKWEKKATLENSRHLVAHAKNIIDNLAKQAGIQLPVDDHVLHKIWIDNKK